MYYHQMASGRIDSMKQKCIILVRHRSNEGGRRRDTFTNKDAKYPLYYAFNLYNIAKLVRKSS